MERFRNKLSNLEAEEIEIINLIEMVQNSSIPNKYNLSEYLCKGSDQGVLAMEKDDIFLLLTIWEKNQSIVEDVSFLINHSRNQSMFMSEMPEFIENPQESFHIPHLENGIEVELDHSIISSEKAKPKFNTSIFSPRKPKDSPSFSASQKFRFQQAKGFFSSAEDPNLSGSSAGSLAKSKDYPFRLDEIDSPDLLLDTSRPNMMNTPARVADNDSASPFGVPLQNNSPFRKADRLELASDNERTPIDLKSIISEKKIGFFDSVPLRMDQEQNASNLISLSPMNPSPGDGNPLSAARSAESGSDVAESPIRSRSSAVQRNSPLILHAGISKLSKAPLNPVRERPVAPSPLRNNLEPLKELEPLERISIDADNSFVNSINKTESPSKYKKQVETLEETLAQFGERISELENQNEVLVLDNQSMRKQTVELKSKCSSLSTQNIVYEMDISKLKAELTQLQSTGTGHYGQLKGFRF